MPNRSVLGAILLDNNALNPAIEHLRPEDFFSGPAPARVHAK